MPDTPTARAVYHRFLTTQHKLNNLPEVRGVNTLLSICDSHFRPREIYGHDVKLSTFIDTDGTTADDSFLDEVVRPLLAQVDVDSSLKAFYRILQHRAEHMDFPVDPPDLQWSPASWTSVRAITIGRLCTQMLSRLLDGVLGFHEHAMAIMQYLNEVIVVIPAAEPDIYRRIVELSTDDKFKLNISYELRVQLLSLTVRLQDRFGNPDSKDANWKSSMVLGHIALDLFTRTCEDTILVDNDREQYQSTLLKKLHKPFDTMPVTETQVFNRMLNLFTSPQFPSKRWEEAAELKVPDHGFRRPFRKISMSALWCASRLDYNCYVMIKKRVRDVLDDAFAAIKAAPSIISLFGAISIDEDWNDIRLLLVACEDLEKMDNIIIRPKFIKALEELARNCPDHQRHCNQIRGTATILHELNHRLDARLIRILKFDKVDFAPVRLRMTVERCISIMWSTILELPRMRLMPRPDTLRFTCKNPRSSNGSLSSGWNRNASYALGSARICAEVSRRRYATIEFDTGQRYVKSFKENRRREQAAVAFGHDDVVDKRDKAVVEVFVRELLEACVIEERLRRLQCGDGTGDGKGRVGCKEDVFNHHDYSDNGTQAQRLPHESKSGTTQGQLNHVSVTSDPYLDVITPTLDGTILPGITRDSCLSLAAAHPSRTLLPHLLPTLRLHAREQTLRMSELARWNAEGRLIEVFTTGTAVVITGVGRIGYNGKDIILSEHEGGRGPVAHALYERLLEIQEGRFEFDGWSIPC
ncbi:hypothetical protein IEO21_06677 [Rhodonia placenta]|uniref:Uncharacterized protein n=1 Tax=Rhodonia placenta TaxID=104341 RepID=A0A8H7NZV5_9APHY|nr:hypothetical protein IEO21_06677 [Postia placenta]